MNKDDLVNAQAEMLVYFKAFDESFSSTVVSRSSYISDEFVYGGKFVPMYHPNENRSTTILEIDKLDEFEKVTLPQQVVEV
jgi:inward rectifier potassium channel